MGCKAKLTFSSVYLPVHLVRGAIRLHKYEMQAGESKPITISEDLLDQTESRRAIV